MHRSKKPLFDHLVGTGGTDGHGEAERLSGLEIDHQLVVGWGLHRHVGRLFALEDEVDKAGRAPVHLLRLRLGARQGRRARHSHRRA
jgi:hypothetical protein